MITEIVDTRDGVLALRDEWNALFDAAQDPTVFAHFAWVYNALELSAARPLVILVRSGPGGRLVGVAPLAVTHRKFAGRTQLALVHAAGGMADFAAFLVCTSVNAAHAMRLVADCLRGLAAQGVWELCWIEELSEADPLASLFIHSMQAVVHGDCVRGQPTPYIRLASPFGTTKVIREIRRRERKLEASATVRTCIAAAPQASLLATFREHHARAFPGIGFSSPRGRRMIDALAADPDFAALVDFSCLLVDGELAAGHFGFRHAGRLYYYVPAFDQRLARFGPGQLLLHKLIEHYRTAGCERFEFLRGPEPYKNDWMNAVCYNRTLVGVPLDSGLVRRRSVDLWLLLGQLCGH